MAKALRFSSYFDVDPNIKRAGNTGDSYKIEYIDNTIKTEDQAGYTHTRPRTTRMLKKFTYAWNAVSEDDAESLRNFYEKVGTYKSFLFDDYITDKTVEVRFAEPLHMQEDYPYGFHFTITFQEV